MGTNYDLKIPENGKIKVYWSDSPENYSKDNRLKLKNYFSKKYDVDSKNVNIVYKPTKTNSKGETIEIEGAVIDNILSIPYQRSLFKEWLNRENKKVNIDKLIKLDDKVNGELNIVSDLTKNKKYSIKTLSLNNFLSFGEDNILNMEDFKGLTVVNSLPENQGGKSVLTIDAIKFLFFGTTTKTDTNSQVFNTFTDKNEVNVNGLVELNDGQQLVIDRRLKRTAKRSGGWNVTNKVNYYEVLPDGSFELMNDEDAKKTTKSIKDMVGLEKDFDLMVLATSKNLDDLIDSSTTESGKLFTKFIGLEVLSLKEAIVRKMANTFYKTMKSNIYSSDTLKDEIVNHEKSIKSLVNDLEVKNKELTTLKQSKECLINEKVVKASNKINLIDKIKTLNPEKIELDIENITKKGKSIKVEIDEMKEKIKVIGTVIFDEDLNFKLNKEKTNLTVKVNTLKSSNDSLNEQIDELIKSGICKTCNRKLDDVNNSKHIDKHKNEIKENILLVEKYDKLLLECEMKLLKQKDVKDKTDLKNKLELKLDRLTLEIDTLRLKIKEKNVDLKTYNDNLKAITKNREIDSEIEIINTKIVVFDTKENNLRSEIQNCEISLSQNKRDIISKNKIITSIENESEVEKTFKVYTEMIGEKGISKLILRSVLPIINSEIQRLIEDVTDFDIEIFIDEKNKVKYSLIKNEIEKPLKSGSGFERTVASIALRCVLGKLSSLPTPNFITFDEVLGRVASNNIHKLKPMFDKISEMYDTIYFITQNDSIKDWGDKVITVIKEKDVSKITIN